MDSLADQTLRGLRVLVVDDHDINRDFLKAGLSGLVAEVATAKDGRVAVELCQDRSFDVVLMDLHMPRMDGLTACQRIRQSQNASGNACILILTADVRPGEQDRLVELGADGHLNKPISIPRLLQAILEKIAPEAADRQLADTKEAETRLIVPEQALEAANGDRELAARMSQLFAEELGTKLPALDHLISHGEIDSALKLLHQWRGACGFAGAGRLYQACEVMRKSLLDPEGHSIGAAYLDFTRTAHATRQALMSEVS